MMCNFLALKDPFTVTQSYKPTAILQKIAKSSKHTPSQKYPFLPLPSGLISSHTPYFTSLTGHADRLLAEPDDARILGARL